MKLAADVAVHEENELVDQVRYLYPEELLRSVASLPQEILPRLADETIGFGGQQLACTKKIVPDGIRGLWIREFIAPATEGGGGHAWLFDAQVSPGRNP